jgi:hypothetical protein
MMTAAQRLLLLNAVSSENRTALLAALLPSVAQESIIRAAISTVF